MLVHTLSVGALETNCYLALCPDTKEGVIIDPAAEAERILATVRGLGMQVLYVVNTHGHIDHVTANDAVREATGAPLLIHSGDAGFLERPDRIFARYLGAPDRLKAADRYLTEGEDLAFGACSLKVLHTPGHTPGGISLYGERVVFTGDALFNQGVGRTDLPGGDWEQLLASIRTKLFTLPDDTVVYPGHGPSSTVGDEREGNPYL